MLPRAEEMLGPLFAEFTRLGLVAEAVVYADDAADDVRRQLLGLDGVLVWVNPIQDGADRSTLDALLREASAHGVWVSAHPDVILAMGTKEVLYSTRTLGWGTDTDLYESFEAFAERFPRRLGSEGVRVVKQGRGNGGNGVWKVQLHDRLSHGDTLPGPGAVVEIEHAQRPRSAPERTTLGAFVARCRDYFSWSGFLIDQPFVARLGEGMVRCYFVHDEVVGFCHQWPKGLLGSDPAGESSTPTPHLMEAPHAPAYAALKAKVDREWIPQFKVLLSLGADRLPVIWDADFLYGPKTDDGADTFVLCEINVSAVGPYPLDAAPRIARTAADRMAR